ncbi:hypothetical protein JOM56_012859 [Amanita muscaria]
MLEKGTKPQETFTKEIILRSVAQFVVCNDQALAVASNVFFRNCLVSMRPKTKRSELPSTHDVSVYIHNQCVDWLAQLKKDISVSTDYYKEKTTLTNP